MGCEIGFHTFDAQLHSQDPYSSDLVCIVATDATTAEMMHLDCLFEEQGWGYVSSGFKTRRGSVVKSKPSLVLVIFGKRCVSIV